MLLTTNYYGWFDKLKRPHIEKEKPVRSVAIQSYDQRLKSWVRFQNEERTKTIKEYCKTALPKNYYLLLANEQYTVPNGQFPGLKKESWMYFDFKYKFLYCPTPKVTHYLMQNISRKTC